MRRVHVIVDGMVQGVGYRYTLRMVAQQVGASGWVRNRTDGTVEAEVEGTPAQVDEVLAWMSAGAPGARVRSATVVDQDPVGTTGFDVLRDR
ncbi:acylphosphatase [Microbacterium sp.]|uniref:acylphosphatase n=1 Tax=Microbacterium sp. TaxID=51671 RepID=UPI003A8B072A